ncbi:MAG: hypothetical protein AB9907_16140 [Flexilinea sp.]
MQRSLYLLILMIFLSGCTAELSMQDIPTLTALPTLTERPTLTLQPTYTTIPTYTKVPNIADYLTARTMKTETLQPTLTPLPTLTQYPTLIKQQIYISVTPYQTPTALVPSELGFEFNCGDQIGLTFTYMNPKIQQTLTEHYPVGNFLMMQIQIRSLSGKNIAPLQNASFTLFGSLWGRDVRYDLDRNDSDYANSRWSTPKLDTAIGSNPVSTFIVFDINPETQNFTLEFSPVPKGNDDPICSITMPLPKVIR